jgi:WD40 repeat protein
VEPNRNETVAHAANGNADPPAVLAAVNGNAEETISLPAGSSTPPSGAPGRHFGDYELIDEIARGGMGVVYQARQISLNRIVALKMILAGQFASDDDVKRFHSEARAAANLEHPGIVPVFEVGRHEGQHYFTMGYVRGQSLAARVALGPLPPNEAARIIAIAASAVQHAHQHGIIHRDLKPGNILIDEQGLPRVTDFGLAKRVTDDSGVTVTGQILGTPSYMPPEQAAGRMDAIGPASDVYALGAVLYTLLVGRPPFQAAGPVETLMQVIQREPFSARKLNADVPVDLDTIALKCLEKDPQRRFASASELADELQRYLNGQPILSRPVGRAERVWRWCKRQPKVAALSAAVGLLLTFVIVASPLVAAHQSRLRRNAETNATEAQLATLRANAEARQAETALYQARLNETRALRLARQPGWQEACHTNLRQNAHEAIPARDFVELRTEAVHCMGEFDAVLESRLGGHGGGVWSLDFAPDGNSLASADYAGVTRVWDLALRRPVREVRDGHVEPRRQHSQGAPFPAVRFHPDGQQIAHSTWNRGLATANWAPHERPMTSIGSTAEAQYISFDRLGDRVAVAWSDGRSVVYEAASGTVVREVRRDSPALVRREVVVLHPDGQSFATAGPDHAVQWHSLDDAAAPAALGRHQGPITSLAFSPDGAMLVSSSEDHTARIFDVRLRKETAALFGHGARVQCAAFDGDGRLVATASDDRTVRLWRARTGELVMVLRPQLGPLLAVAFSANGERLAASSDSDIVVYRLTNDRVRQTLVGHTYAVSGMAFHPTQPKLLTASWDNTLACWNLTIARREQSWPSPRGKHPGHVAISPDGALATAALMAYGTGPPAEDHALPVWNVDNGQIDHSLEGLSGDAPAVAFDATGKRLAAAGIDGTTLVWDLASKRVVRQWTDAANRAVTLAFLDGGSKLLTAHSNRRLLVRDVATGKATIARALVDTPNQLALWADETRLAIATTRGRIVVYSLPSLDLLAVLAHEHGGPIASVAVDASGRLLASGGSDRRVILWDARRFQKLLVLPEHEGAIFRLAFEPGGHRLAICGVEEHVTIWNLHAMRQQLAPLGLDWRDQPQGP